MDGRGRRVLRVIFVVAGLAGLVLATGTASAGEYHVYSCRTPSGESAPTDGWTESVTGAYDDYATDTCGTGGALTAALGDLTTHVTNLDIATWTWSVPAGETLVGATLWRAGDADGGEGEDSTYEFWLGGVNQKAFDACVYQSVMSPCLNGVGQTNQPLSLANQVVIPSARLGAWVSMG
jgi:hypothetical protein